MVTEKVIPLAQPGESVAQAPVPMTPYLQAVFVGWGYKVGRRCHFQRIWPANHLAISKAGTPIPPMVSDIESHPQFDHWETTLCKPGELVWLPRYDPARFNEAARTEQFAGVEWQDRIVAWHEAGMAGEEMCYRLKEEGVLIQPLPGAARPGGTTRIVSGSDPGGCCGQ
jgi:hypothetical protein